MTISKDRKNMKSRINMIPTPSIRYSVPILLFANSIAWAEISSLSSEELTDTYIQDTTVIVRQQKAETQSPSVPVQLKVTPLEQATQVLPEDPTHTTSGISHELTTYDDLNNLRALDNQLTPELPLATTEFLKAPTSQSVLDQVRNAYNIDAGDPIDLATLPFLTNLTPSNPSDIPVGSSYQSTDSSFTIRIPNLGNFNSQQIASPNGEIGVNVTPSHIEYTLNLPK
jgi:hypothetical protein